nr:MAG TPA: hypothetical protein [Caudoviricetes sp.]
MQCQREVRSKISVIIKILPGKNPVVFLVKY